MIVAHAVAADEKQTQKRIPVSTDSLTTTHELIGPLGRPVGEVFTVDLMVHEKRDKGYFEDYVEVTTVDSKPLTKPVIMPARLWQWSGIKSLSEHRRYRVRVYQDAGMMGVPHQAMRETTSVQTTSHAFVCWLVIVKSADSAKQGAKQ